ncbi:protein of unknown function [Dyella sp. OK004]|uniref:DUF4189 domain-containing protein n=1 Tax=Dyella sp. OK004 TaxID=1855292 RepID=UPI0008EE48D8|nr:DUF4189 domain-containing protein [Dyella sp. OK004]SFS18912.1 protein of unknown function [Dyella sp. OK004]
MDRFRRTFLFASLLLLSVAALAQDNPYHPVATQSLPAELKAFVPPDTKVIFYKATGTTDGSDAVVVLERQKQIPSEADITSGQRPLLMFRRVNGVFKEVDRNNNIIACSTCGDFLDDPFGDHLVDLTPGHMKIEQIHGGHHPSSADYTFVYDRAAQQWRVVSASRTRFGDAGEGAKKVEKLQLPSDTLLTDFDPQWHRPEYWNALVVNDKTHAFSSIVDKPDEQSLDEDIHGDCQSEGICHVLVKQKYGCMALVKSGSGQFFTATSTLEERGGGAAVSRKALDQCTGQGKSPCEVLRNDCSTGSR